MFGEGKATLHVPNQHAAIHEGKFHGLIFQRLMPQRRRAWRERVAAKGSGA
jgi:hypothetical protein